VTKCPCYSKFTSIKSQTLGQLILSWCPARVRRTLLWFCFSLL